KTSIVAS
nr:Chain A, DgcB N-terminus [Bdellovibrio bacteriovorus HD100]